MSFVPYAPPKELTDLLREKQSFRLATHVNPDADGLGSLLGLGLALSAGGKTVSMVRHEDGPSAFEHLPGYSQAVLFNEVEGDAEVLILFDCHEVSRIGPAAHGLKGDEIIVVIDHHLTEDGGGDGELEWLEPRAAASAALVHSLVSSMDGLELSPEVASCLYAGLITDTGGFRFSNTDAVTLRVGSDLVEHGADAAFLADAFLHLRTPATLRLLARVLESFDYRHDGQVVFATMTKSMCQETEGRMEDTEGFVNFATSAKGVKLVALFKEESPRSWRLSLRGNEPFDVRRVAKLFSGGGHARAAGCTVSGTLEEVRERIAVAFGEELARGQALG